SLLLAAVVEREFANPAARRVPLAGDERRNRRRPHRRRMGPGTVPGGDAEISAKGLGAIGPGVRRSVSTIDPLLGRPEPCLPRASRHLSPGRVLESRAAGGLSRAVVDENRRSSG